MGRVGAEIMAYRETLTAWDGAVKAYHAEDLEEALEILQHISEPTSRIFFNMSCVHRRQGSIEEAAQCLDEAVTRDQHFALGYFQRGVMNLKLNRLQDALADFEMCVQKLRGCPVIDYKQLGLLHKLYHCEVVYNQALVYARWGQLQKSEQLLREAAQMPQENRHGSFIERALQSVKNQQYQDIEPVQVPDHCIFHPPKSQVANLKRRDYMGKARVVSSYELDDTFTGFDGIKTAEDIKKSRSQPNSPDTNRKSAPPTSLPPGLLGITKALGKAFRSLEDIRSSKDESCGESNGKKRTPPPRPVSPKMNAALKQMAQCMVFPWPTASEAGEEREPTTGQELTNQKPSPTNSSQSEPVLEQIEPEKSTTVRSTRPRPPPPNYKPPPLPKIVVSSSSVKRK